MLLVTRFRSIFGRRQHNKIRAFITTRIGYYVENTWCNKHYLEKHDVMWEKLLGFYTNGAPTTLRLRLSLATSVKGKNV